jgi:hypothetical protein
MGAPTMATRANTSRGYSASKDQLLKRLVRIDGTAADARTNELMGAVGRMLQR